MQGEHTSEEVRVCVCGWSGPPPRRAEGSNRWGGTPIDAERRSEGVCVGVRIPSVARAAPLVGRCPA